MPMKVKKFVWPKVKLVPKKKEKKLLSSKQYHLNGTGKKISKTKYRLSKL